MVRVCEQKDFIITPVHRSMANTSMGQELKTKREPDGVGKLLTVPSTLTQAKNMALQPGSSLPSTGLPPRDKLGKHQVKEMYEVWHNWCRKVSKSSLTAVGGDAIPASEISDRSNSRRLSASMTQADRKACCPKATRSCMCFALSVSMASCMNRWHCIDSRKESHDTRRNGASSLAAGTAAPGICAKRPQLVYARCNVEPKPMAVRMLRFAEMSVHVIVKIADICNPKGTGFHILIIREPLTELVRAIMVNCNTLRLWDSKRSEKLRRASKGPKSARAPDQGFRSQQVQNCQARKRNQQRNLKREDHKVV